MREIVNKKFGIGIPVNFQKYVIADSIFNRLFHSRSLLLVSNARLVGDPDTKRATLSHTMNAKG